MGFHKIYYGKFLIADEVLELAFVYDSLEWVFECLKVKFWNTKLLMKHKRSRTLQYNIQVSLDRKTQLPSAH